MKRQDSYEITAYKIADYAVSVDKNANEIVFLKDLINRYSSGIIGMHYREKRNEYFKNGLEIRSKLSAEVREIFIARGYTEIDYSSMIAKPIKNDSQFYKVVREKRSVLVQYQIKKYRAYQLLVDKLSMLNPNLSPDEVFNTYQLGHKTIVSLGERLTDEFVRTDVVTRFISESTGISQRSFTQFIPKIMAFYGYKKFIGKEAQADGRYESHGKSTYIYRKENSQITLMPIYMLAYNRENHYQSFIKKGSDLWTK